MRNAQTTFHFTLPKTTTFECPNKTVFLLCCEPVLCCAFHAQNRLQFACAKCVDWNNIPLGQECISVAFAVFDAIACVSPCTL